MNGVLGHESALVSLYWAGDNWANGMNFVMNHAPGAGSLARLVAQQSSVLSLYHGCPLNKVLSVILLRIYTQELGVFVSRDTVSP